MYYTGYNKKGIGSGQIGMATSPDGITWTKYDDPATTDAAFAASDPVMVPPAHFDFNQPMAEQTPDGWVMTFRQVDTTKRPGMYLNYALSDDGIHWNIAADKPFWDSTSLPGHVFLHGDGVSRRHLFPVPRRREEQQYADLRRHPHRLAQARQLTQ